MSPLHGDEARVRHAARVYNGIQRMIDLDIASLHQRFRQGTATSAAVTKSLLERITKVDDKLAIFEHVATTSAHGSARAFDLLRESGTDLGPLMGIPIVVKDLIAVDGMPTRAGSQADVGDFVGAEGPFVGHLRRAGCVFLGKVKTVEFGMGGSGLSSSRGTPWNPHDLVTHRAPGGSSSGSSTAVAAGVASFAIGSDTGGSIRVPAAFSGIVGWKTSQGLFPKSGVFPLSADLDTLGLLTRSVEDAATIFAVLRDGSALVARPLRGLRVGAPGRFFLENLQPEVAAAFESASAELRKAGAVFVDIELPRADELDVLFANRNAADIMGTFGPRRFNMIRSQLGQEIEARASLGLKVSAGEYLAMRRLQDDLAAEVRTRMDVVDCWIAPTTPMVAPPISEFDIEDKLETDTSRFTRQANYFRLCALSMPLANPLGTMPVGLQVVCPLNADDRLLGIGRSIEQLLGRVPLPDIKCLLD